MSNCWKCGREIPEGVECSACDPAAMVAAGPKMQTYVPLDWSKINTLADFKRVLEALDLRAVPGSPFYKKMKRMGWLKE